MVPFIDQAIQSSEAPYDVWQDMPPNHRDPKWSTLDACRGWRGLDYVLVANGHLERGERIETFLPEIPTDFTYPLNIPDTAREKARLWTGSVLLYLSGEGPNWGFHRNTWSVDNWVQVIYELNKQGITPVLVGANTTDDLRYRDQVKAAAWSAKYADLVGTTSIPEYVALIEAASCWIGLNSGGGIVSAMLGTPTVMMWSDSRYPHVPDPSNYTVPLHENMRTSWLAPEQLKTYRTLSYGSPQLTPENVIQAALEVAR
jgi:ADP-heptose:LPS heptosyltransferase